MLSIFDRKMETGSRITPPVRRPRTLPCPLFADDDDDDDARDDGDRDVLRLELLFLLPLLLVLGATSDIFLHVVLLPLVAATTGIVGVGVRVAATTAAAGAAVGRGGGGGTCL